MSLIVNEIFYSLQGEGGRAGEASIFIRLSGCNLSCAFCDTEFESGILMSVEEIWQKIAIFPCHWLLWTGGEPTLQLTDEILGYFKKKGYFQAVESNGTVSFSTCFDYTVCSPKGKNIAYARQKNMQVSEVRLPVRKGDLIPEITEFPQAKHYFVSPIFEKNEHASKENITFCVDFVKLNPTWRLSLQTHKLIDIP